MIVMDTRDLKETIETEKWARRKDPGLRDTMRVELISTREMGV